MSTKLSSEAARAKYEYNKKYQHGYWERRAAKEAAKQAQSPIVQASGAEVGSVSVERNHRTDPQYIKALETSNRTLNSENRRLVKLLHHYQGMVAQSTIAAR